MLSFRGAWKATPCCRARQRHDVSKNNTLRANSGVQARDKDEAGDQADLSKAIIIFVLGGPGEDPENRLLHVSSTYMS